MIGKCSEFGGPDDNGMNGNAEDTDGKVDSGLAYWEPHEANNRKDMFMDAPKDNPKQEVWRRLRTDFPYIAMRFDKTLPRKILQNTPFKITNIKTGAWAVGFPVDYGPGIETRLIDLSPGLMKRLGLQTDDEVEVERLI